MRNSIDSEFKESYKIESEITADSRKNSKRAEIECSDSESEAENSQINNNPTSNSLSLKVTEQLTKKYEERQGKQLFIRFPSKLPVEEEEFQNKAKQLSPLIVRAHKPRQKYARFCLVDFNSRDDRDSALKTLRADIKKDESLKGIFVAIPRTENENFLQDLLEKKYKSIETKRAKLRLKRASKQSVRSQNLTSSIVVMNLPKSASTAEIRKVFPNAIDIQVKLGKGGLNGASTATITMPSTIEASRALKQTITIGGSQLVTRFETKKLTPRKKKFNRKQKFKDNKVKEQTHEQFANILNHTTKNI